MNKLGNQEMDLNEYIANMSVKLEQFRIYWQTIMDKSNIPCKMNEADWNQLFAGYLQEDYSVIYLKTGLIE